MAVIVDSYSETNRNGGQGTFTARPQLGQSFTGDGGVLDSAVALLTKSNSPTGNAVARIYAHSGTFGTNGIPTGSPLATSDGVDVSAFPSGGTYQLITFNFSGAERITLANGTKYFLVIEYSNGDGTNFISWGEDNSSPTHAGNRALVTSGTWTGSSAADFCFYVYKEDTSSPSVSPSASQSPSVSPSASTSPSSSSSASASSSVSRSPSPSPGEHFTVLDIAKDGINVLNTNSPQDFKFSSRFGTLKYFAKVAQQVQIVGTGVGGDFAAKGIYTHNLGYYPFVEVFVRVYIGSPSGNYEYVPFFGAGASILYTASYIIKENTIELYAEFDGVSASTWNFDFLIFLYKNKLNL